MGCQPTPCCGWGSISLATSGGGWTAVLLAFPAHSLPHPLPPPPVQEVVVIEAAAAREATQEILKLHSIPAMVSKDLSELLGPEGSWPEAPPAPATPPPAAGEAADAAPAAPAAAEVTPAAPAAAEAQQEQEKEPEVAAK